MSDSADLLKMISRLRSVLDAWKGIHARGPKDGPCLCARCEWTRLVVMEADEVLARKGFPSGVAR